MSGSGCRRRAAHSFRPPGEQAAQERYFAHVVALVLGDVSDRPGVRVRRSATGAEVAVGADDAAAVTAATGVRVDRLLSHGDTVAVGDVHLEVLALRGHTPGSVALAYREHRDWDDAVLAALRAFLDVLAAEPAFARLAIVEAPAAGPRAIARRDALVGRFAELFDDARMRADGAIAPPPLVAQAIAGGIHELVYSRLVRGEADDLPALVTELSHYAFMLLGVEPRDAS